LPSEEVTPPVTKTYFAMGLVLRGFFECYRKTPGGANRGPGGAARGRAVRAGRRDRGLVGAQARAEASRYRR
jgi:hypothetical protein